MEKLLEESIAKARRGRESWIKLTGSLTGDFAVVLFPSGDREINDISLKYAKKLAEQKEKVVLLTFDEVLLAQKDSFPPDIEILRYEREEAEELMKFYALYQFTDKLFIASLTEPEGRTGKGLIGRNGITLEELIALGIFGINVNGG